MRSTTLLLRLLLFIFLISRVSTQITTLTGLDSEILNLVDAYFDKQGVVPVQTLSNTMDVTIDMSIVSINKFDDDNERVEISGYLILSWTEERLTRTTNTLTTTVTASTMWVPLLTLINCACTSTEALVNTGSSFVKLDLNTGASVWKPWFYGTVLCEPNMKYFPFDEHKCRFKYTATHHTSSEVLLSVSSNTINQDYYNANNEWTIKDTSAKSYLSNSLSIVEYELTIKRKPQYMLLILLVPLILISFLNVFSFFVPAKTNQRIGFSVTNLLGIILLFALVTLYIPAAASSMSLFIYFVFAELLINSILVVVVVLSERSINMCSSMLISQKSHTRNTPIKRSSSRRGRHRVGDRVANTKHVNKIGVENGVTVTESPLSVWDDDLNTDVVSLETKGTNTDEPKELDDQNKRTPTTYLTSSFDMICVLVFLSLHVIFAVSFLTPLALNV